MVSVPATAGPVVNSGRFDWYAATINSSVEGLRAVLASELGGDVVPEDGARHGFKHREVVKGRDGVTLATLLHGGNGDLPHAFASSDHTDRFVEVVRHHYGPTLDVKGNTRVLHRVSRMDSAIDFDDGPGTWDRLFDLCCGIADGERVDGDTRRRVGKVKNRQVGNWRHAPFSRTFYLGAEKSAVTVRLYEKGMQLIQDAEKRGRRRDDVSTDLVRLEVQVRPDGDSKSRAATATPSQAFGYSEWSRELLRRLDGSDVERVNIKERRESDHERALNWMAYQYESHILQDVAALGSWEAFGRSLRRRLEVGHASWDDRDDPDAPF